MWEHNQTDPDFTINSELKRTEWELSQIKEAMIVQTQYMLNMGNDLTTGGGSYSIGNINASWSRPVDREIVAPGVYKLLQNARVYQLQNYGFENYKAVEKCNENKYDTECITRNIGDKLYVALDQGKEASGNVAVVGTNGIVNFSNPNDLNFSNFSATRIKDWNSNDYVEIDKITNQLFRGDDLYGVHSGVQRGEVLEYIKNIPTNGDAYTKAEIDTQQKNQDTKIQANTNIINEVIDKLRATTFINYKGEWREGTQAVVGQVYSYNGKMYLCKNNTNTNPSNKDNWDLITSEELQVDLSDYYTKLEIDNQQTKQDNKIETLSNDLEELGNNVSENTNYIENVVKTTYSPNKWNNAFTLANTNKTSIEELNTKLNDLDLSQYAKINDPKQSITSNQYVLANQKNNWTVSTEWEQEQDGITTPYLNINSNVGINLDLQNAPLDNRNFIINCLNRGEQTGDNKKSWGKYYFGDGSFNFQSVFYTNDGDNILYGKSTIIDSDKIQHLNTKNNKGYQINFDDEMSIYRNEHFIPTERSIATIQDIKNEIAKLPSNDLSNYYTKKELSDYSVVLKPQEIKPSENTSIDNYNDTEITLKAPQKITCITNANGEFRTETRQDGFYINNKKAQPIRNVEIMNNETKITELGDNKVMVIAQMSLTNYRNNGQDLYNGLPNEVKNLRNVRQIEYFEYNFVQYTNDVNKVFTNYVGNIAASVYENRIYLRNEMALPSYLTHLRFKLIYDKS